MGLKIIENYLSKNDCFLAGRTIIPKGIMVHSTATPGVMAADWFDRWNKPGIQKCVHAFLDDKEVYQHLPWNYRGWHSGGYANNTHIGFEICEPGGFKYDAEGNMLGYDVEANQGYFEAIWNNAIALCVMFCQMYNLTEENIICHSEGAEFGIASNHADVMHWFPKHGKNMDMFRAEIKASLACQDGSGEDENMIRYKYLSEVPKTFQSIINTLMDAQIINGDGSDPTGNNDIIDLSHDQIRTLVFSYRAGAFDRKLISMGMKPVFEEYFKQYYEPR